MNAYQDTLFASLLRNAKEGVIVHEASGEILFCNNAVEQMFGLHASEIVGSNVARFAERMVREDGSSFLKHDFPALVTARTGEPCTDVIAGIARSDRPGFTWMNVNSALVPDTGEDRRQILSEFSEISRHISDKHHLQELWRALAEKNRKLEEAEAGLRSLLRAIPDPVWLKDLNGVFLACNPEFARLNDATEDQIVGSTDFEINSHARAEIYAQQDNEVIRHGRPVATEEWTQVHKGRQEILLEKIKAPMVGPDGHVNGVVGIGRDITARKRTEQRIADQLAFEHAVLAGSPIGIAAFRPNEGCVRANEAFGRIFGIDARGFLGKTAESLFQNKQAHGDFVARITPQLLCGATATETVAMHRADGTGIWAKVTARMIDPTSQALGSVFIVEDVTERRRVDEQLQQAIAELSQKNAELDALARIDPLTELANRRTFTQMASSEFLRSRRYLNPTSILMIDVDRFKHINDTYGHESGDLALIQLARTLRTVARATDVVARLGGEEFAFLLTETDTAGAVDMADRIRTCVERTPVEYRDGKFNMTVSIGESGFRADDSQWTEALSRADKAMYTAKTSGRNRVVAYESLQAGAA